MKIQIIIVSIIINLILGGILAFNLGKDNMLNQVASQAYQNGQGNMYLRIADEALIKGVVELNVNKDGEPIKIFLRNTITN